MSYVRNTRHKWELLGTEALQATQPLHLITCKESGSGSEGIITEIGCAQFLGKSFSNNNRFRGWLLLVAS